VTELDKILTPDFVCQYITRTEWKGIDGVKNTIASHRKSFSDWKEEIVDVLNVGDSVVFLTHSI